MPPVKDPATGKFVSATDNPQPGNTDQTNQDGQQTAEPPPPKTTPIMQRLAEEFLTLPKEERQPEKKGKEGEPGTKPKAPAKPKAAPARKPAAPQLTAEQIANAAAEGTARAFKKEEPKTKPAAESEDFLNDTDKKRLTVLARMEELFPGHKGLVSRFKEGRRKEAEYRQKWQAEHPGEDFDPEAEVHDAFYAATDVDWPDEDYMEAQADIRADAKVKEYEKKIEPKLTEFERERRVREATPQIAAEQVFAAKAFWTSIGDDLKDVITDQGVNGDRLKELEAQDPVVHDIRVQFAQMLNVESVELYKLLNGLATVDMNNPVHSTLSEFCQRIEQEMAKAPYEETLDKEGREFLTAEKYYKLPKEEREARYWTPGVRDFMALRSAELAGKAIKLAKKEEEKLARWAQARGLKPVAKEAETEQTQTPEEPAEETVETDDKPHSPSDDSEPRMAALKAGSRENPPNALSSSVLKFIS